MEGRVYAFQHLCMVSPAPFRYVRLQMQLSSQGFRAGLSTSSIIGVVPRATPGEQPPVCAPTCRVGASSWFVLKVYLVGPAGIPPPSSGASCCAIQVRINAYKRPRRSSQMILTYHNPFSNDQSFTFVV